MFATIEGGVNVIYRIEGSFFRRPSMQSISIDSMLRMFTIRFMITLSSRKPVIPIPLMLITSYRRKRKMSNVEYMFARVSDSASPK